MHKKFCFTSFEYRHCGKNKPETLIIIFNINHIKFEIFQIDFCLIGISRNINWNAIKSKEGQITKNIFL